MTLRTVTAYAGSVVSDDGVGTLPWSDPENAEGEPDGVGAVAASAGISEWALCTDYDLGIPSTATPLTARLLATRRAGALTLAQQFMLDLEPTAMWGFGEASGDALDLVGSIDGTVTLETGTRNTAALDDGGDGAITFAGGTRVNMANAAINNPFTGGGAFGALIAPTALSTTQRIARWAAGTSGRATLYADGTAIRFSHPFSGGTGLWTSESDVLADAGIYAVAVLYDDGATANNPTIYVYNVTAGTLQTLTVGSGLTETGTPSGTATVDADNMNIGTQTGASTSGAFIGRIDELWVFAGSQPTPSELADYFALVRNTISSDPPPEPVIDSAVRVAVAGAVSDTAFSTATWPSGAYATQTLGPADISALTAAQVNATGFGGAISVTVPSGAAAVLDAAQIEVTYDIAVDITFVTPATPGAELGWAGPFEVSVAVDGTPVTLSDARWRIYADEAETALLYDSGVVSGAVTHVVNSGTPARPWSLPREGVTYYLRVDVLEDGGYDGGPIEGSASRAFSIDASMGAVGSLTAEPVTEEEEGS